MIERMHLGGGLEFMPLKRHPPSATSLSGLVSLDFDGYGDSSALVFYSEEVAGSMAWAESHARASPGQGGAQGRAEQNARGENPKGDPVKAVTRGRDQGSRALGAWLVSPLS